MRSGETAAALALKRICLYSRAAMNQLAPADFADVEGAIRAATDAILAEQRPDGHWVYELEADATIPAEYVLLVHYLAETPNLELERKIGVYLRRIQGAHGGWPLYHDGAFDISRHGEGLFRAQDDRRRYRRAAHGAGPRGDPRRAAAPIKANVFTRILLALYGADVVERTCRPCRWN